MSSPVATATTSATPPPLTPHSVALIGLLSLATAMGIGRFAFTPLLPMMLHDGVIGLSAASLLASTNYFGYLLGALFCTFQPWIGQHIPLLQAQHPQRWLRSGLIATALLALAMALPVPALWPAIRFAAGLASAIAFIYTSGWCINQLSQLGRPTLTGLVYAGPGVGIAVSGLLVSAMVALQWRASWGWFAFGLLAALLSHFVWRKLRRTTAQASTAQPVANTAQPAVSKISPGELTLLALAYGTAGLGYIITATFLPVIARDSLPNSPWLDLFWPILGIGTILGALFTTRVPMHLDRRNLLALSYGVQAAGVVAGSWFPSLTGFIVGSFLVGLPFTVITFFALQEVRRLAPHNVASIMGLITAVYGIGQIIGPMLVPLIMQHSPDRHTGFTVAINLAAASLVVGMALYWFSMWRYPAPRSHPAIL